ncbi:MAG: amidohydrolase family protein [Spirochaetaceae bacterium]|nr:amidohydrolase family protein [Spirochaetaceae bacterium]
MPRIDAHAHVFAKPSAQFPRAVDEDCPAGREEPVGKLLEAMHANRIGQAVLVQIGGAEVAQHAYLLHCLREHRDRFRGIGLIPPGDPEPERHMDRLAAEPGIIGFRLFTVGGPRDPFAPIDVRRFATYRIWKHAAAKDYVIWLYARARDAHLIPYLLEQFPQVRVVVNHLGICPGAGAASRDDRGRPRIATPTYNPAFHTTYRLNRYENVVVKLSGQPAFSREQYPYRDLARWHHNLFEAYGPGRLMWGSDFPWNLADPGYARLTSVVRELLPGLSEADHAAIMGANARRFLRFPSPNTD